MIGLVLCVIGKVVEIVTNVCFNHEPEMIVNDGAKEKPRRKRKRKKRKPKGRHKVHSKQDEENDGAIMLILLLYESNRCF